MKLSQVAAQLYTVRDLLQTPTDIARTLKRIRQAGYTAVQISGMGPIEESGLVRILEGEGLTCCATHEPGRDILENTPKVIDRLAALGCRYTAYPFPAGIDFSRRENVIELARGLDAAGAKMRAAGQVLTYHNHAHEFYKLDGQIVLDLLLDKSAPENLQAEIDTYWVQAGGCDPVAWCEKLSGRLPLLHLKDYQVDPAGKPVMCEIGAGTLDFPNIISAAEESGCRWFIVEQDVCPGDPVDSLKQSLDFIAEHLAESEESRRGIGF